MVVVVGSVALVVVAVVVSVRPFGPPDSVRDEQPARSNAAVMRATGTVDLHIVRVLPKFAFGTSELLPSALLRLAIVVNDHGHGHTHTDARRASQGGIGRRATGKALASQRFAMPDYIVLCPSRTRTGGGQLNTDDYCGAVWMSMSLIRLPLFGSRIPHRRLTGVYRGLASGSMSSSKS
jgi:hypothetical protein